MTQTVLIENNEELNKVYALNLEAYTNTNIIKRQNAADTIELLSILPNIDLIITNSTIEEETTALMLATYIEKNKLDIPIIITGQCSDLKGKYPILPIGVKWQELAQNVAKVMGISSEQLKVKIMPEYFPISIKYFYEVKLSPCDLYIRIKKADQYNYIKRLHMNDHFTKENIQEYENNGLRHFYVEQKNKDAFTTFMTNKLIEKLENKNLPIAQRLQSNAAAYDLIKEKIKVVGLDEQTIDLANASIESMVIAVKQSPKLAELLRDLLSNKVSFAYQKAHFLTVIGDFILSKQSWYQQKHLDLFTFCAFFSDISLDTKEQMLISTTEQLKNSNLSEQEKSQVCNHAKESAKICAEHPDFTTYLNMIITQHHGNMEGIGFELDHEDELHPISKVFIIADQFVTHILNPSLPTDKKVIIKELRSMYPQSSFQKIISLLEKKMN
ncbi:MAG: hypothetical protein N4A33_02790 [Bacteriovoracaceae bacterium]|jgi:response regulator RpfG family c-di-GMP phosphodiesterase|nr:hypothetical protein [Bacteriovoracaceae bacterium]